MSIGWILWAIPGAMLALMGILWVIMRVAIAGPPTVREGYITGVVGRMGQGKSLYVMTLAAQHLKTGGTVISNFKIDTTQRDKKTGKPLFPETAQWAEYRGWVQLLEQLVERMEGAPRDSAGRPMVAPAVVLLDEAHLYAPASGQVLPEVARWILSHLRKCRAEMYWCSQHEERCATGLRQQTTEMVKVVRGRVNLRSFRATHWEPEKFRKRGEEPLFRVGYSLAPKVISLYRSWDLIRPDVHADEAGAVRDLIDRLERVLQGDPDEAVTSLPPPVLVA